MLINSSQAYKFKAFISYRRMTPDSRYAKWLHNELERFKIPIHARSSPSRNRVGRVFRDQEELSASSDLSRDIETALKQSEWLIVICSTTTPDSHWIASEIRLHQDNGRGERILLVLIDGEPACSFPHALSSQPLAADLRLSGDSGRRDQRRDAFLKVVAPLIGCSFGDLRERDAIRRRKQLRLWAAASSTLVILFSIITTYALLERSRSEEARNDAQREATRARSHELASRSMLRLRDDPASALTFAIRAAELHESVETWAALGSAVTECRTSAVFPLDMDCFDLVIDPDARFFLDDGRAPLVVDLSTGKVRFCEYRNKTPAKTGAFSSDGQLCALALSRDTYSLCIYSVNGEIQHAVPHPASFRSLQFGPSDRQLLAYGPNGMIVVDVATGEIKASFTEHGVRRAEFSAQGGSVLIVSRNGTLHILSLSGTYDFASIRTNYKVRDACWMNGDRLAVSNADGSSVELMDPKKWLWGRTLWVTVASRPHGIRLWYPT